MTIGDHAAVDPEAVGVDLHRLFVVVAGPDGGSMMPTVASPDGYPASGYDHTPRGRAMLTNIANLAADLVRGL